MDLPPVFAVHNVILMFIFGPQVDFCNIPNSFLHEGLQLLER